MPAKHIKVRSTSGGEFDCYLALPETGAQAPGIVLVAGVRQTVPVFYALKDTKTPVWASAASLRATARSSGGAKG